MVYELLQDYFVPNDFVSSFDLFFEVCGHIVQGHVSPLVSCLLSVSRFLTLKKQYGGICSITIGEVTYYLVAHKFAIHSKDTLVEHFSP
jgi:hypothetical protein